MGIFENTEHLNPKYQDLDKFCDMAYKSFWTPAKYKKNIIKVDAPRIKNTMKLIDRQAIERCILAVILVEDRVKLYWPTVYYDFPQTIIGDVGGLFGMMEVTHRKSYNTLATALDVSLDDAENNPVLNARINYLKKHQETDPKIIGDKRKLKKLVLFSTLVERCSLFTQFYILMSYAKRNRGLQTVSALQQSTATEEAMHYMFGIALINIIKEEKPQLWSDYLTDLVSKNLSDAYEAELKLIDWFFEAGVPEHIEKEEVINFLDYNFYNICNDLELDCAFDYDREMYEEKNEWFTLQTVNMSEPDFFNCPVGGYSSTDEEDIDDIFG